MTEMKKIFFAFFFLCVLGAKAQDTTIVQAISKRYAYEIEVFSPKGTAQKVISSDFPHRISVQQNDTLKIFLKDRVLNIRIAFTEKDSAHLLAGQPLGVASGIGYLRPEKEGYFLFYSSKIKDYQNFVQTYGFFPCAIPMSEYFGTQIINNESEVARIFSNLCEAIKAKKNVNVAIFELVFHFQ